MPNRYIHYQQAADQFVGRVVAGLRLGHAEFALLPPHFTCGTPGLEEAMVGCFPYLHEHKDIIGDLRAVLSRCLASLVCHSDWLLQSLPENHIVRTSWLFRHPAQLAELKTLLCHSTSCEHLTATGISPDTNILREVVQARREAREDNKALREDFARFASDLTTSLKKYLDEQGIKSGNVTPNYMLDTMTNWGNMLTQTFEVGIKRLEGVVLKATGPNAPTGQVSHCRVCMHVMPQVTQGTAPHPTEHVGVMFGNWADGKPRRLPPTFKFPHTTLFDGWRYWLEGDPSRGYPPFR